jgi:phage terminase small subunit
MGQTLEDYRNAEATAKKPRSVSDGIVPEPPKYLSKVAKAIYRDAAKRIVSLGVGASCDANMLALYAIQMERVTILAANENRDLKQEKLLNDLIASTFSLSKDLALSPGGRARMRVASLETPNPLDEEV